MKIYTYDLQELRLLLSALNDTLLALEDKNIATAVKYLMMTMENVQKKIEYIKEGEVK